MTTIVKQSDLIKEREEKINTLKEKAEAVAKEVAESLGDGWILREMRFSTFFEGNVEMSFQKETVYESEYPIHTYNWFGRRQGQVGTSTSKKVNIKRITAYWNPELDKVTVYDTAMEDK